MSEDSAVICVIDTSYGRGWETQEEWEELSTAFKAKLEAEFGRPGELTSVGFGAAAAAYLFQVDWHSLIGGGLGFSLLFAGKRIKDSIQGYCDAYDLLRKRFFSHDPVLDRTAACCVAIKGVADKLGNIPTSIEIIAYARVSPMDKFEGKGDPGEVTGIEPPEERIKDWIHVFRISTGTCVYRIFVERSKVTKLIEEAKAKGQSAEAKRSPRGKAKE